MNDSWATLRQQRNSILQACDWVVGNDSPVIDSNLKAQWIAYRQALRDLPASTADPTNPVWPTPPGGQ